MVKLYLDIDGVLNPYPKMGKIGHYPDYENIKIMTEGHPGIDYMYLRLSKKMGQEILRLNIDIIWNTTWCDIESGLVNIANYLGLQRATKLNFEPYPIAYERVDYAPHSKWEHYRDQKLNRLLDHVREHNEPFIWCDDEAIDKPTRKILTKLQSELPPHLLVQPHSGSGITNYEMDMMREFVENYSIESN